MFVLLVMCCMNSVGVSTVRIPGGGAAALPGAFLGRSSQSGPPTPYSPLYQCTFPCMTPHTSLLSVAVIPGTLNPEDGHLLTWPLVIPNPSQVESNSCDRQLGAIYACEPSVMWCMCRHSVGVWGWCGSLAWRFLGRQQSIRPPAPYSPLELVHFPVWDTVHYSPPCSSDPWYLNPEHGH